MRTNAITARGCPGLAATASVIAGRADVMSSVGVGDTCTPRDLEDLPVVLTMVGPNVVQAA